MFWDVLGIFFVCLFVLAGLHTLCVAVVAIHVIHVLHSLTSLLELACAELHAAVAALLVVGTRAGHDAGAGLVASARTQRVPCVGGPLKRAACVGFGKWRGCENTCLGFIF